jgi:hypothetical protein
MKLTGQCNFPPLHLPRGMNAPPRGERPRWRVSVSSTSRLEDHDHPDARFYSAHIRAGQCNLPEA